MRYPELSYPDADCVMAHSFGTSLDPGSPNSKIANTMSLLSEGRPMMADRTVVEARLDLEPHMAHIVDGDVTNFKNGRPEGIGTWGTLVSCLDYMQAHDLERPLMVGQAHHIGRILRQAKKLGIDAIKPAWLPANFDQHSEQIWTRSLALWLPYNAMASLVLKKRGQL